MTPYKLDAYLPDRESVFYVEGTPCVLNKVPDFDETSVN